MKDTILKSFLQNFCEKHELTDITIAFYTTPYKEKVLKYEKRRKKAPSKSD